jgi:hypothetical protein
MGVPKGITLICGGGFHGKSTLLGALQVGVYPKLPGDGREFCLTSRRAFKIRAEDGRGIQSVDISTFINNLPFGKDTTCFTTPDASGSTSQATNIVEVRKKRNANFMIRTYYGMGYCSCLAYNIRGSAVRLYPKNNDNETNDSRIALFLSHLIIFGTDVLCTLFLGHKTHSEL